MFDDDWEASVYLYPCQSTISRSRPPITLLVIAIGENIIFDPSREELAVAESALAVSVAEVKPTTGSMQVDSGRELRLLSIRTIDPPSRLTPPGVPNAINPATGLGGGGPSKQTQTATAEIQATEGVWKPPIGGTKFAILDSMVQKVMEKGGIANEVLDGIDGVELS
jgi:exosome complex component RRP42